METKKFISTVKGFRTRFGKTPNVELERKQVEGIVEKMGGKIEVFQLLKAENPELLDYVKGVLGIVKVKPAEEPKPSAPVSEAKPKKTKKSESIEVAPSVNGKLYEIDTIKKTCHKVIGDFSQLADIVDTDEMSLTTYQRYLKDRYFGEDVTIKKGKLHFRGYRISCTKENGFMIEDTTKKYKVVDTPFEGIPTPAELGDFFETPRVEHTSEELAAAVERGKEAKKSKKKAKKETVVEEEEEPDFDLLRKKVLSKITWIRNGKLADFDPMLFADMIPFRRWQKNVKALLTDLSNRKIRYKSFLNKLEELTREETFETPSKEPTYKFVGTLLPEFHNVERIDGDKIIVDGKAIPAVPFLVDYLLHYCPEAMYQLMRFVKGDITATQLLKNPIDVDKKIEFNKKLIANTVENVNIINCLFSAVDLYAPQDILWEGVEVGDKILILLDKWSKKEITAIDEEGIFFGREVLLKSDKWIKLED